jgi:hypothetical protein
MRFKLAQNLAKMENGGSAIKIGKKKMEVTNNRRNSSRGRVALPPQIWGKGGLLRLQSIEKRSFLDLFKRTERRRITTALVLEMIWGN